MGQTMAYMDILWLSICLNWGVHHFRETQPWAMNNTTCSSHCTITTISTKLAIILRDKQSNFMTHYSKQLAIISKFYPHFEHLRTIFGTWINLSGFSKKTIHCPEQFSDLGMTSYTNWMVVSTPLTNISQIGSSSQLLGKKHMFQTTNQLIVANPIIPSPTESTIDPAPSLARSAPVDRKAYGSNRDSPIHSLGQRWATKIQVPGTFLVISVKSWWN